MISVQSDDPLEILVEKISNLADDADMFDLASACAMVVAYSIAHIATPGGRDDALDVVINFIRQQTDSMAEEIEQEGRVQ